MKYIEVKNLRKSYYYKGKEIKAVDNVSFDIKKGEIFGLLGPNGAGKTTTIDILSGILSKDSGEIRIFGKDPAKEHEYVRNRMNVSTAYYPLSSILSVYENLKVYAKLFGVKNYDSRIKELMKDFEIQHLRNKKVGRLSSGEQTRTSVCKGLINNPKILLLDECTVGLDPAIAERTRTLIKDYHKEHKPAILFTSHYMFEVEELCKRIAFMSKGKIINIGSADALKKLIKKHTIKMHILSGHREVEKFFKEKGIDVYFLTKHVVRFDISAKGERLYALLNSLFKRGVKIKDLHIRRPTLDDIFIKIAKGEVK